MMIPKIIHQIWFNFKNEDIDTELPEKMRKFHDSWINLNPKFQVILWNDSKAKKFVQYYFPELFELYNKYKHPIYRVDVFRILVLYQMGGIYADMDLQCLKNIDPLFDFLSTPTCKSNSKSTYNFEGVGLMKVNKFCLTNWFICASPKQDFLKHILDLMQKRQNNILLHRRHTGVGPMWCTGPLLITNAYNSYSHKNANSNNLVQQPSQIKILRNDEVAHLMHHDQHATWFKPKDIVGDIGLFLFILLIIVIIIYIFSKLFVNNNNNSINHLIDQSTSKNFSPKKKKIIK